MRKPSLIAASALCGLACAGSAAAAARAASVDEIAGSLRRLGAEATIRRYFDCRNGPGYAVVASGDPQAVALGAQLRSSSDACVSELLADALGRALARRPQAVLPLVNSSGQLRDRQICVPFIPAETPKAQSQRILARSERAVAGVRDPRLARQRAACLKIIHDYQAAVRGR